MSALDIVLALAIAALIFFAVRKCVRDRRSGSCCDGNCADCRERNRNRNRKTE